MANGGTNYKDGGVFCAQGSFANPSGLFHASAAAPYKSEPVLVSFFGRPFILVVATDGSIWFTDPGYGFGEGYRPKPRLPKQADIESRYAFDMTKYGGGAALINRRVFAMTINGFPDSVKCDLEGNVCSGCGDEVHVWSPGGVLFEIYCLMGTRVFKATLSTAVKGALLGI
ncbi:hypothetical protein LTR41_010941 [Exophiala xenobiotica]|nr:hypothetical protein LTR41_010941 [Exophiala xenobiotica]KAK5551109.1 hypothetical protein LTR46_010862 [Exophiala xenobiotica]